MERSQVSTVTRQFKRTFGEQTLNELGRIARFCQRERQVTPVSPRTESDRELLERVEQVHR